MWNALLPISVKFEAYLPSTRRWNQHSLATAISKQISTIEGTRYGSTAGMPNLDEDKNSEVHVQTAQVLWASAESFCYLHLTDLSSKVELACLPSFHVLIKILNFCHGLSLGCMFFSFFSPQQSEAIGSSSAGHPWGKITNSMWRSWCSVFPPYGHA